MSNNDDYAEYAYQRTVHANDSDASLRVPAGIPMEAYDIENWKFSEMSPNTAEAEGAVYRLRADCTLFGCEKLKYEWYATETDISEYGGNNVDRWKEYVMTSFALAMLHKKVQRIKAIQEAMKIAVQKSNKR